MHACGLREGVLRTQNPGDGAEADAEEYVEEEEEAEAAIPVARDGVETVPARTALQIPWPAQAKTRILRRPK